MSSINDLEAQIKDLKERLYKVELATQPFRIGDYTTVVAYWHPGWTDPRPAVSHAKAIELLMAHSGLSFSHIPTVPERIELVKKPK